MAAKYFIVVAIFTANALIQYSTFSNGVNAVRLIDELPELSAPENLTESQHEHIKPKCKKGNNHFLIIGKQIILKY